VHALHLLEDSLEAPEAASAQDGGFKGALLGHSVSPAGLDGMPLVGAGRLS
jgi:hypothetical protein